MSTNTLVRAMQEEIESLNNEIDLKIIRGVSYRNEARRHRFLSAQLAVLTRPAEKFKVRDARRSFYDRFIMKTSRAIASFTL